MRRIGGGVLVLGLLTLAGCDRGAGPADVLRGQLPAGSVLATMSPGPSPETSAGVLVTGGRVTVELSRQVAAECPDPAFFPHSVCSVRRSPDGSMLMSEGDGATRWTFTHVNPDGRAVVVSAYGSAEPPVPASVLSGIAASGAWRPYLQALPRPRPTGLPSEVGRPPAARITAVLARLVDPALRLSSPGGSAGLGHLTADDGHGPGLITVTVQAWPAGDPTVAAVLMGSHAGPDGTRVRTRRSASGYGGRDAATWTVDTLRRDGLRVVVTGLNAPAYTLDATRPTPVLSMAALERIALDPAWQSLPRS